MLLMLIAILLDMLDADAMSAIARQLSAYDALPR